MIAGWVDSICLSFAWTLLLLEIVERHGLRGAGVAGAAMLIGIALSAPVASHLAQLLGGCGLLRTAAGAESLLRVGVFALLVFNTGMWSLVLCIAVMNITAWTGYAGMRAEVAAVAPGPKALTMYGTGVAAVEALGAAAAAFVPARVIQSPSLTVVCIVAIYVAALVPTVVVAGGSRIGPARAITRDKPRTVRPSLPLTAGVLLMGIASGPTLLAVALAAEWHGRSAVPAVALAFAVGSLSAPFVCGRVVRRMGNGPTAWLVCAVGMLVLWPLAPLYAAALCAAQLLSGLFMTTLEGLLDAKAAAEARRSVTGALARATAGRALGSAAGVAALPVAIVTFGFSVVVGGALTVLTGGAMSAKSWSQRQAGRTVSESTPHTALVRSPGRHKLVLHNGFRADPRRRMPRLTAQGHRQPTDAA